MEWRAPVVLLAHLDCPADEGLAVDGNLRVEGWAFWIDGEGRVQQPQQPAGGGIEQIHQDDADQEGAEDGIGGHSWAGKRHRRLAPVPSRPRAVSAVSAAKGSPSDLR